MSSKVTYLKLREAKQKVTYLFPEAYPTAALGFEGNMWYINSGWGDDGDFPLCQSQRTEAEAWIAAAEHCQGKPKP